MNEALIKKIVEQARKDAEKAVEEAKRRGAQLPPEAMESSNVAVPGAGH